MKGKEFKVVQEARAAVKEQFRHYNEMMNGPSKMKTVKGNLIDLAEQGEFNIIVQGCNCFETMGSGLAREIKARYPAAYEADIKYSHAGDYNKLGCFSVMLGKRFNIVNAYTQYGFLGSGDKDGKVYNDVFEYDSFNLILQKLAHFYPTSKFGFPLIGCGLAGGDKDRIVGMLEAFARSLDTADGAITPVTLVEFQP